LQPHARIDELKATGRLPSPTGVGLAIMRLTHDEDSSSAEIAKVIQSDPALTGRLLQRANSVSHASRHAVASVPDALVRLGLRAVGQLALGFSLLSGHRQGRCEAFDYAAFWSCSLAVAVAAEQIARDRRLRRHDELFACGLLGQIGRLGLACVHPERYSKLLDSRPDGRPSTLLRLEREHFGIDHNDLGAALLDDWGIPEALVAAVRCHETLAPAPSSSSPPAESAAEILHLARALANHCAAPEDLRRRRTPTLYALAERRGIGSERLAALCTEIVRAWRDWGEGFEIQTQDPGPLVAPSEGGAPAADPEDLIADPIAAPASRVVENEPPSHPAAAPSPEGRRQKLRILVIDDDPVLQKMVRLHLTRAGHQVEQALDGRQGLEMIVKELPDLILTDWMMPALDGLKLCRALRRADTTRGIYVIMLTSREDEESILEAFEAGADDYIIKPFRPRSLIARIRAGERIVGLQEQVRQDREKIQEVAARLSVLNRRLEQVSLTDSLTELPNRRAAMKQLEHASRHAARGMAVSCMIIDIDHFKIVNDTRGHAVGDLVLREVATLLKANLRGNDQVFRFGGEEFLVICEGTELRQATHLAERLREAVARRPIAHESGSELVTVSIGLAELGADAEKIDDLLKTADRCLYRAKEQGRNRVCWESEASQHQA